MNKLLTDKGIEELNEEIEQAKNTIEEGTRLRKEKLDHVKSLRLKIKSMSDEIEEMTSTIRQLEIECNEHLQENRTLDHRIRTVVLSITDDTRQKAINELVEKQSVFWTGLTKAITEAQDELDETTRAFVKLGDPAAAVDTMKSKYDHPKDFSREAVEIRSHVFNYTKLIEALCTSKIDGRTITISDTKGPQQYLKDVAYIPSVMKYWQN